MNNTIGIKRTEGTLDFFIILTDERSSLGINFFYNTAVSFMRILAIGSLFALSLLSSVIPYSTVTTSIYFNNCETSRVYNTEVY